MTKREIIIETLNHRETDTLPYCVGFTTEELKKVVDYTKNPNYAAALGNFVNTFSYDPFFEVKPGYFQDEFSVVWNRSGVDKDIGVIEEAVIPSPDLSAYTFPPVAEAQIREVIETRLKDDIFNLYNLGFSMFERAWTLCTMEELFVYFIENRGFVHALLDAICAYNLKKLDIILEYDEIDGVMFGDDWGQQRGLIMGPGYWREFIKPRVAEMYKKVRESGKYVFQHSCGDIREILPDLVEIGLNCYQTFQPEIYDPIETKSAYGDKLTFWGGISIQRLLPYGTPDEVRRETRRICDLMRKGGGFIAGPSHAMPYDIPAENVLAMMEVLRG